jgi:hypothetical protein
VVSPSHKLNPYSDKQQTTDFDLRGDSQKSIRLMAQPKRAQQSSVFSE